MKCAACGNENQSTAKFCVHCGVLLSPVSAPAAAAAVAGTATPVASDMQAAATVIRPAPSTPAGVARPESVPVAAAAQPIAAAAASAIAPPVSESTFAPTAPAYTPPPEATSLPDAAPAGASFSKTPIILGTIAIVVVLAIGFVGYRALYGNGTHQAVAVAEPQKSAESPVVPAASVEPAKDESTPAAAAAADTAQITTPPSAAGEPAKVATSTPEGLPGAPATPPKARSAQPKRAAQTEAATAEQTTPAPQPARAPPKAAPQVAAAAPAPVQLDHWQMYADAMSRCAREDFFRRIGCEQKTRNQYCDGYWGTVAQCPGTLVREHGQ